MHRTKQQEPNILIFSRTILDLFLPPSGPLLVIALGALLLRCHKKIGRALVIAGFISIYLLSTGLVANLLVSPLEHAYPPLRETVAADAIVILTNGARDLSYLGLGPRPDMLSLERTHYGYVLYRQSKITPIIVSGGRADPSKPELSIGATLGNALLELGMPKKDLIVEDNSLNTYESALRVAEILKNTEKKVVLVTSGYHMGRSAKLYKKAGFTVIPAPTNFLGGPSTLGLYAFIPQAHNLGLSSTALYEYFCRLWYFFM